MTHLNVKTLISGQMSDSDKGKQMTVTCMCSTWKVNTGKEKLLAVKFLQNNHTAGRHISFFCITALQGTTIHWFFIFSAMSYFI
jgi:hypothetical protein